MPNVENIGVSSLDSQRQRIPSRMDSDSSASSKRNGAHAEKQSGRLPATIKTQPMLYTNAGYFSDTPSSRSSGGDGSSRGSGSGSPFRRSLDFLRRKEPSSRRRSMDQQQQRPELQRRSGEAPQAGASTPHHGEPPQQRSSSPRRGAEPPRRSIEQLRRGRQESPLKSNSERSVVVPGPVPVLLADRSKTLAMCEQNVQVFMDNARGASTLIFPATFFPHPCTWDQLATKLAWLKLVIDRDLEVVKRLQAIATGRNIDRSRELGILAKSSESARRLEEVRKGIQSRRQLMSQSLANIETLKKNIGTELVDEANEKVLLRSSLDPGMAGCEVVNDQLRNDPTCLRGLRLLIFELGQIDGIRATNYPAKAPLDLSSWQGVLDDLTLRLTTLEESCARNQLKGPHAPEELLKVTVRMRTWITFARKHVLRTMDHGPSQPNGHGIESSAERLLR